MAYSYDRRAAQSAPLLEHLFAAMLKGSVISKWMDNFSDALSTWDEEEFWKIAGGSLAEHLLGLGRQAQDANFLNKTAENYLSRTLERLLSYKTGSIEEGSTEVYSDNERVLKVHFKAYGESFSDDDEDIELPEDSATIKGELIKLSKQAGAKSPSIDERFVKDPFEGAPYRIPEYHVLLTLPVKDVVALERKIAGRMVATVGPKIKWGE